MNKENFKDTMLALIEFSITPDSTPVEAPFELYLAGFLISARAIMPEEFKKAVGAFNAFEQEQAQQMLEKFWQNTQTNE